MLEAVLLGVGAGLLAGLVGLAVTRRIEARFKDPAGRTAQQADIWQLWGIGMLLRLAVLVGFVFVFLGLQLKELTAAVISMSGIYLVMLLGESARLCSVLARNDSGKSHG